MESLLLKSLVSQNDFSFPTILAHFYERRKILTYMYVMILLTYFVILYFICFSQQKQVHITIIHIKSTFKKQRIILLSQNLKKKQNNNIKTRSV